MPSAIVVFAEGFEEIEAVTPADILRRASVQVELVGLNAREVTGAHGITIKMDRLLADRENVDAIILPGGMPGATNLAASEKLAKVLKAQDAAGRIIAAICASPGVVLGPRGVLDGKRATCYPGFEDGFPSTAEFVIENVVEHGKTITSRGPGTAFDFALALTRALVGDAKARQLGKSMLHLR
ncbi:MAG TPA: DJ-1/PfpI family protein [Candidatus Brocadiia bacterium]|nr:DJ-1/PfpI family protein [Candidatus Brocadiia bacterium]